MFPILTAAVIPSVQLPPEGMADAPVQQPADGAFVEAVARALARGASRQSTRSVTSDEADGANEMADPSIGAWAAGLNFQPTRFPLAQEQSLPNALGIPGEAMRRNAAGSLFPGAVESPAVPLSSITGAVESQAIFPANFASVAESPSVLPISFADMAHSLRLTSLSSPASTPNAAGAVNEPVQAASSRAGAADQAMGGMIPTGASIVDSPDAVPMDSGKGLAAGPTDLGKVAAADPAASVKAALTSAAKTVSADASTGASVAQAASAVQAALANAATRTKAGRDAIPEGCPVPVGFLQGGTAVSQPGNGATSDRDAASTPKTGESKLAFPGSAVQTKSARTTAKAKAAPLQETAAMQQAGAAGPQADAAWVVDGGTAIQQTDASPEAVQGLSARMEATAAQPPNARTEAVTVQPTSARPEAAAAREINPLRQRDAVFKTSVRQESAAWDASALTATQASAGPVAAGAPQETTAAQAANAQPDAAALPEADIAIMAAQAPNAGAAPEPAAARRAERKGLDAARAISAQPQDSAAQAGQYARTQAAARQENAYKGQALKPEPDAERDQDAARSRPVGGRQQAAPGAIPTVGEGPGSPPAEQAAAPAPAGGQRTSFDPGPAAQLARAALGAVGRGETRFHLKLRPEGVGEVAVTISAKDNDLRLMIRAGSESTRDLILSQIGGLKQELTQGGYRLEGFSVDVSGGQGGQGGQAFAFRQDTGGQSERRPDVRPQPRSDIAAPKEARFPRIPEARAGSINLRI